MIHHNLENVAPRDLMPLHLSHGGIRILVYRDFDDWLASSIMKSYNGNTHRIRHTLPSYIISVVEKYFEIRQEALNPMYFKRAKVIHYDAFVHCHIYRETICANLGGDYSEDRLDFVPANGHHSSFDGNTFKGNGSEMKVLNRADQILETEHKEFYLKIMKEYDGLIRIHR